MRFVLKNVSEELNGRTLLEIEPAPLSSDGTPDLCDELADLITPYLEGDDNIHIRYEDEGLPTTAVAVLGSMDVELEEGEGVTYSFRSMTFKTATDKIGCNIHIRPDFKYILLPSGEKVGQQDATPRTYDFREVYEDMEQASDDVPRLVQTAHEHFMGTVE